jgi:hypothetical protein
VRQDVNALIVAAEAKHRQHLSLPLGPVGDAISIVAACYQCWAAVLTDALDARKSSG